jgi:arylsulfatase A-like enzyme
MKAIMIMFDSLNKHMLPSYGCDWVEAPNFERLAEKTVTLNTSITAS